MTDSYFYYKLVDGSIHRVKHFYDEGSQFSNSEDITDFIGGFDSILLQKIGKSSKYLFLFKNYDL